VVIPVPGVPTVPLTDVADVDLADPDVFAAGPPWAAFAALRRDAPVAWTPEPAPNAGFWSVTRHADVVAVSRDWRTFTTERNATLEELDDDQLAARRSMLETDGSRHRALRRLLQREFSPVSLRRYETFLRGLTALTLDAALAAPELDFVAEVSADYPGRILARMLGLPDGDVDRLIRWAAGCPATPTRRTATSCSTPRRARTTSTCRSAARPRGRSSRTARSSAGSASAGAATTWSAGWRTPSPRTACHCPMWTIATTSWCLWWPATRPAGTRSPPR
jgi:cytochrome P450